MKQVKIGSVEFSKVICGTNAFYAHSHFSDAKDSEYRSRFTDECIEQMLRRCFSLGINTVETCANERIFEIVGSLETALSEKINMVGTTRIDETSGMKSHQQKVSFLIEHKASMCVVHAQYVDRPRETDQIPGLDELVSKIHDAGLLAGISTHQVKTVEVCERQKYGIDAYLFPLNLTGFVYPGYEGKETVSERIQLIRNTPTPFIFIKTLGAGRILPVEGLQFVAEHARTNDLVSIGFGTEDEIEECVRIAKKYF
jgi:hypothetical protein